MNLLKLKIIHFSVDMISLAGSKVSARSVSPGGSFVALSDRMSLASGTLAPSLVTAVPLTPQQLGAMGLESLESVIMNWEDALTAHGALSSIDESEFCREIQNLLDLAYNLQDQSELLFLDERSVLFREESNVDESERRLKDVNRFSSDPNLDSAESFASALDQVSVLV